MAIINGTNFNDNNTVQFNGAFDEFFPSLEGTVDGDTINGLNGTDILNGSDGNDTLNGGAGADDMNGGDQNDTYFVDNTGNIAAESFNDATGGVDTVNSSVSHTLGFGIENLNLIIGAGAINGTGNENNNIIIGNSSANFINGGTGADTMDAGDDSDIYVVDNVGDVAAESFNDATGGVDTVNSSVSHTLGFGIEHLTLTGGGAINGTGNENGNSIVGNAAANVINGGTGADIMDAGDGNDIYIVDNLGDIALESFNDFPGGVDTVNSSVSHGLGFGLEHLNLTGGGAINGTGNENNNIIIGNSSANFIDGGTGADTMNAGDGSDTYVVDNVGDVAAESFNDATGGVDTVNSSVSHTLGFGIEHLTLTGGGAINGTGNGNDNSIVGNAAANVLNGGSGSDTLLGQGGNDNLNGGAGFDNMQGGLGNDTYTVDNASDTVTEAGGAGTDLVNSSISYNIACQCREPYADGCSSY